MSKPKVMLGIPTMGAVNPLLMVSVLLFMREAIDSGLYNLSIFPTVNIVPVDNARNSIVDNFLKSDCTHLLFIDSDTIPPQDTVMKMLNAGKEIVSGLTPIIEYDYEKREYYRKWNCLDMNEKPIEPNTGIQIAKVAGSSCIMIQRSVFEKMEKPYYRFQYKDDNGKETMVGEDIFFTIKALAKHIYVHVDTSIVCQHQKSCIF